MPVAERPVVSTRARGLPLGSAAFGSPSGPLNRRRPAGRAEGQQGRPGARGGGAAPAATLSKGRDSNSAAHSQALPPSTAAKSGEAASAAPEQGLEEHATAVSEPGKDQTLRTPSLPGYTAQVWRKGDEGKVSNGDDNSAGVGTQLKRIEWTPSNVSEALKTLKELQEQGDALARGEDAPSPQPLAITEAAPPASLAMKNAAPTMQSSGAMVAAPVRSVKVQAGAGSVPSVGADVEVERRMSMLEELRALQREALTLL